MHGTSQTLQWSPPPESLDSVFGRVEMSEALQDKAMEVYETPMAHEIKYWYTRVNIPFQVVPVLLWAECQNFRRGGMIKRIHQHFCVLREASPLVAGWETAILRAMASCGLGRGPLGKHQIRSAQDFYYHTLRELARSERKVLMSYATLTEE